MTWILILTVFAGTPGQGVAVASVPGFQSQQACITAATQWAAAVAPAARAQTTACVASDTPAYGFKP